MKKLFVYTGNLEYSGLMPNPGRWVKAEDYETLLASYDKMKDALIALKDFHKSNNIVEGHYKSCDVWQGQKCSCGGARIKGDVNLALWETVPRADVK